MAIQKGLLFVFLYIHLYNIPILAQLSTLNYVECGKHGNYTKNSAYQNNLKSLLTSLSSNMDEYGFYNASIGQNTDKVSAIVLCRGDMGLERCRSCVDSIAQRLVERCPNQKEANAGYDECSLQYSNRPIIDDTASFPTPHYFWNDKNASKPEEFNQDLTKLLVRLRDVAANGGPHRKYASGNATGPDFQTIYALVQCTPNLSRQNCFDCLADAYGNMPNCLCKGRTGGRIVGLSCYFRYEADRFFNDVPFEAPPPAGIDHNKTAPTGNDGKTAPVGNDDKTVPTGKDDKKVRLPIIIIIIVPTVTVIILTVCIFIILMKKRKRKPVDKTQSTLGDGISTAESLQYELSTIRAATNNFSNDNKLGQGGFGPVYKGTLPNGQEVAVKRLSAASDQGELEFKNEVLLVAWLQHRNLVKLKGFCLDGTEKLLVYEFVPNASLDHFLFDPVKRRQLDWGRRSTIIGGIAKGILYLHEDSRLRIIHRDLKAANVLLDAEMNPKISDFGMAKLFKLDETHVTTIRIVGTYGYMAPESIQGQLSCKSDVYSFGVLVLEIVSGRRNTSSMDGESTETLLSYARWSCRGEATSNLIDPMLMGSSREVDDMKKYINIALLCIQVDVASRPTMAEVVHMINSHSSSLPLIEESNSTMPESAKSESICSSPNETSIIELYPRKHPSI